MSREILFRGRRKDSGEWVEGYYQKFTDGRTMISKVTYSDGGLYPGLFKGERLKDFEVIPKTIGQYTGLSDSMGKRIFEGDLVRISGLGEYECEFPFNELYYSAMENDICEVMGTIHGDKNEEKTNEEKQKVIDDYQEEQEIMGVQ